MRASQEIKAIAEIIFTQWKLRPETLPFSIDLELLEGLPNVEVIMEKLDKQFGVIKLIRKPYANVEPWLMGKDVVTIADEVYGSWSEENLRLATDEVVSYEVLVKPEFDKWFSSLTKESSEKNDVNEIRNRIAIAYVRLDGNDIYVGVKNETEQQINRLRTDLPPYVFIHFLINHNGTEITRNTIKSLDGLGSISDLSELIRSCGFDKTLKDIFFPISSKDKVKFINNVPLYGDKIESFIENLKK
ncbi:MAG: hypothetical protein JWN28_190 [Candidatus Saccharibacteria bacterium]|nr:hypothetical protein [Candidatus Saccharibacteria bacterium]